MEYQALYRKYRPGRFDEVIGQDHVTHTLAREIVEGRVAHAYLFAGPRGVRPLESQDVLGIGDRLDAGGGTPLVAGPRHGDHRHVR